MFYVFMFFSFDVYIDRFASNRRVLTVTGRGLRRGSQSSPFFVAGAANVDRMVVASAPCYVNIMNIGLATGVIFWGKRKLRFGISKLSLEVRWLRNARCCAM